MGATASELRSAALLSRLRLAAALVAAYADAPPRSKEALSTSARSTTSRKPVALAIASREQSMYRMARLGWTLADSLHVRAGVSFLELFNACGVYLLRQTDLNEAEN